MAGEELLGLLGANDLNTFNNTIQETDPYGIASRSLAQWQPNYSTFGPGASAGTAFGKAFLSGILGNIARQDAADQLSKVVGVLPQLRSDPVNVAVPEGVDVNPFNVLKGTAILKNEAYKARQADTLNELMQKVGIAGLTKKAEVLGEAAGYDAMGQGGVNPNSPGYKVTKDKLDTLDTLRDKFNKLPEVTSYSQVARAAQAMAGALKDKGGPSDLELVRYAVQMIEPGMAVREGEQQAVLKSGSIPDQWKGELNKSLENGTAISDTVREGLKRLASRALEAQKYGYDKALTYYQGLGEGRGLLGPGESISYLGKAPAPSEVFGITPDMNILKQEAATLKAQGLSPAEIATTLRSKYGG